MFKNKVTLGTLFLVVLLVAGVVVHGWYVQRELLELRRQRKQSILAFKIIGKATLSQSRKLEAHDKLLGDISRKLRFTANDLDISGMKQDISSLSTEFTRIEGRLGSIETKFSYRPGGINCKESIFGTLQCGF